MGLSVDYSRFAGADGGDWAGRLRLATVPGPIWLPGTADPAAQRVSADVDLAGEALVVLAAGPTGPTGDSGDFAQSDLKASYAWVQGGPSGDFSWSYPMGVPGVPGGLVPSVGLGYSSGAVDGQTAGQNAQPSWVGEGWGYSPPFVERTYRPCFDTRDTAPHWTYLNDKPYLCWRAHNAHVVLDGKATEIIRGDDGVWRLADDDGEKVELLTGASNADDNGEHWKISTTDGTQYWFGRHVLPSGRGSTNSTAGVRVFANHNGEPCFRLRSSAATAPRRTGGCSTTSLTHTATRSRTGTRRVPTFVATSCRTTAWLGLAGTGTTGTSGRSGSSTAAGWATRPPRHRRLGCCSGPPTGACRTVTRPTAAHGR